jgi:hypothetical protein
MKTILNMQIETKTINTKRYKYANRNKNNKYQEI